jgi:lipoprotein-releasing system ATP-binding protein
MYPGRAMLTYFIRGFPFSSMVSDIAIRTEGVNKRYRSGSSDLVIFRDLNLEVHRGERLAIVGESGSGKSTLLHMLGGLDRPNEGRIYFGSREITSLSDSRLADFRNFELGFVWQIHYVLPEFTAQENVMMPLLIRGVRYEEAAPVALERLAEVGLRERAHHRAGELSGGEQQRVVLARALVGRPKFLLADEPTGNLDLMTGDRIVDLLDDMHHTHGLTSIYVTHNLSFARRCDRVLKVQGGLAGEPLKELPLTNPDKLEDGRNYV